MALLLGATFPQDAADVTDDVTTGMGQGVDLATRTMDWALDPGLRIVGVILGAVVLRWVLHRVITRFVSTSVARASARASGEGTGRGLTPMSKVGRERHEARTKTMGSLLKSIVTVVIALVAVLTVMDLIGIPLAPLLGTAGVAGVALGFGAQSLVRDYLSGIFMILEDQYGVGDVVDTGEAVGTIEEVTLRVTRLRDLNGVTWYVRNGEILRIGNHSQGTASAVVDVPFSFREDTDRVIAVIHDAALAMKTDEKWSAILLEEPNVLGVEAMSAGTTTVRVVANCMGGTQWEVQRELRRRIKDAFDDSGVQGPDLALRVPGS